MKKTAYTVGGGKHVEVYIPKSVRYRDLEEVYDVLNELFDDEDCFYTAEQVRKLKKDKQNVFLERTKK